MKEIHKIIGDVRGLGLLLSIELVSDQQTKMGFPKKMGIAERLNQKFKENGLIFRVGGDILNIGPPLCITTSEVDEIVSILDKSLGELSTEIGLS